MLVAWPCESEVPVRHYELQEEQRGGPPSRKGEERGTPGLSAQLWESLGFNNLKSTTEDAREALLLSIFSRFDISQNGNGCKQDGETPSLLL